MIELTNECLSLTINEVGAEIKSLQFRNTEYIWEGKKEFWGKSAPVLFPICGGLKEDRYIFCGKEYTLPKHGYAREKTFAVESRTDNKAVFLHRSDAETKRCFPFDYELRITYTLTEKTVRIDYSVKNLSDHTMYFNIGSHEGYATPEGIEEYDVIFPQKETLNATVLQGNLLAKETLPIIRDSEVLPLDEKYFAVDALVFQTLKSRSATLKNRKNGRGIRVDFPDDPYFLIWHTPNAPFICLEPWNGIPDTVGSAYDITQKEGITALAANAEYRHTHSLTVLDE